MNFQDSKSCHQETATIHDRIKGFVKIFAVLTLIAAYSTGFSLRGQDDLSILKSNFSETTQFKKLSSNPLLYEVVMPAASTNRYIAVEKQHGYGGPVTIATEVDNGGEIINVIVIDHKETPAFFKKVQEYHFFEQYIGKKVTAPLLLDEDIDSVSGATVSATAFSKSIRSGSHHIAKKVLHLEVAETPVSWQFGFKEISIIALYAMVFIGFTTKSSRMRYLTLLASIVFLGFYFNSAISISNVSMLFLGYLPKFSEKLSWWLLVVGAFLMILVFKKNFWCQWLCPFGAIQEFTAKISGVDLKPSQRISNMARSFPYILTWTSLIIIFLTSNPALGSYEPFATLFGLEGIGVQWYILPTVILGSFFLNRFWCRFFCPVGLVFRLTVKLRSKTKRFLKGSKS